MRQSGCGCGCKQAPPRLAAALGLYGAVLGSTPAAPLPPPGRMKATESSKYSPTTALPYRSLIQSCLCACILDLLDKSREKPICMHVQRSAFCKALLFSLAAIQGLRMLRAPFFARHRGMHIRAKSPRSWMAQGGTKTARRIICPACSTNIRQPLRHIHGRWQYRHMACDGCQVHVHPAMACSRTHKTARGRHTRPHQLARGRALLHHPRHLLPTAFPNAASMQLICKRCIFIFTGSASPISPVPHLGSGNATAQRNAAPHNRAHHK